MEFAKDISSFARMPIMVTGGIRRKVIAESVIESGVAMVGMATALALNPSLPNDWKTSSEDALSLKPVNWKNRALGSMAGMAMVRFQFRRIIKGRPVDLDVSPLKAFFIDQFYRRKMSREYRDWIARRTSKASPRRS